MNATANSASVVMDKFLDSVYYADELMRLFPAMLFLNVILAKVRSCLEQGMATATKPMMKEISPA